MQTEHLVSMMGSINFNNYLNLPVPVNIAF
jgi:hypothetical protein